MSGLEGIRVVDMTQGLAGPGTCMYLGDQGADVIKIEAPEGGDPARAQGDDPVLGDNSRTFLALNRNKRSLALDIRSPTGKSVLLRLIEQSDVLVTNMRAAATARLGIDYPALRKLNPRLIYGHVTGWGSKGPFAERGGFDRLTQGFSGVMHRRWADGTPVTAGIWVSDPSVPMLMAYGITVALWAREKTGRGQKVETSLLQAAVAMQFNALIKVERAKEPFSESEDSTYGIFLCEDGRYINIAALRPQQFVRLCQLLKLDDLAADPRANDPNRRAEFRKEAGSPLTKLLATRPSQEWLEVLNEVDVPAGVILDRAEVFDQPQILENEMIVRVEHPQVGPVQMIGPPIHLSETPGGVRTPSPTLGQHTDDVLREIGYSGAEIADLRAMEVIR